MYNSSEPIPTVPISSTVGLHHTQEDVLNIEVTPKAIKSRVAVNDISPLRANPGYSDRVRSKRSIPATILTASPYKRKLKEKSEEQDNKKARKVKMLLTSTEKKMAKEKKKKEKEEKKLRKLIEAEIKSNEQKHRKRRASKPIDEVKILKRKKTLIKSKHDEEDTECLICTELFSRSVEDWLQ